MREAQDRESFDGEALCRAVRGRRRDPAAWCLPEPAQGTGYRRDACGAVDVRR